MIIKVFLALCLFYVVHGQTQCHTTSWWVLLPFSKSVLQPFLTHSKEELTFNASNPLAEYMSTDEHPVYFEFNQQNQCQQSSLPPWLANATQQTFVEFKLQIPYLTRKGKTVMLKPLIYQNSHLDVTASHLVYGLPAFYATMQADFENSSYSISTQQGSVRVFFEPLTSTLLPFGSPETANFSSLVEANVSPWLAFPPSLLSSRTKCASNVYDFQSTARLRPVGTTLEIIGDILQQIPSGVYKNPGNQPLGAWQLDVHTTITSTYECP